MKKGVCSSKAVGNQYEALAAEYLQKDGYDIIERNFHCRQGEIDLIARDGEYLCFVEVKYRASGAFGNPLEAVAPGKQRRISRTALYYLAVKGYEESQACRFDVLGISPEGICLMKNAFEYRG